MKLTCEQVARAALGEPAKCQGAELLWRCPNHDDQHPSLSVNPAKNLWLCGPCVKDGTAWQLAAFLAGCDPGDKEQVKAWLKDKGLLTAPKCKAKADGRGPAIAEFIHCDANGNPVYKKVRHEPGANGKDKDYLEWHYEGSEWKPGRGGIIPPLFRLSQIKDEPMVFLFESHTDAERAVSLGLSATTSGGASSWKPEYAETLAGKHVCVISDNDPPGALYAQTVCQSLYEKAASLHVVSIAPHPDFRRWADAGGTTEQIDALLFAAPEWRPADGAALIRQFEEIFKRYIIAPKGVSLVSGLYAAMTHCFEVFGWTGALAFTSPAESCGKSHAADVVGWASARPEILVSISGPALYRLITEAKPTVVIDEAEVLQGDGETAVAVRAILHAGCSPDDKIIRCAPKTFGLERFSPWCPKVFCSIGALPPVLWSRCIQILMQRKRMNERTEKFIRRRIIPELSGLGAKIAVWVTAHQEQIRQTYEALPDDSFEDRMRENFAPLEAILSVADSSRCSELAAVRNTLTGTADVHSDGVQLLKDIKGVFKDRAFPEITSADLASALAVIEGSSWSEYSRGKPISTAKLAKLLKPFEVYPDRIGDRDSRMRGYKLSQFQDAFSRYLSVHLSTTRSALGENEDFKPSTKEAVDTSENAVSLNKDAAVDGVDTLKAGIGGKEAETKPISAPPEEAKTGVRSEFKSMESLLEYLGEDKINL